jgi:hypothetical protein
MGLTDAAWGNWQQAKRNAAQTWNNWTSAPGASEQERYSRYATTHPASGGPNPFVSGQAGSRGFHANAAAFHRAAADRAEGHFPVTTWAHDVARRLHEAAVNNEPIGQPDGDPRLNDAEGMSRFHHESAEFHLGRWKDFGLDNGERAAMHKLEREYHVVQERLQHAKKVR